MKPSRNDGDPIAAQPRSSSASAPTIDSDEFDPKVHEAVAYEESTSQPEGHVTSVMRGGYLLGDRVVRPAQVAVARAPTELSGPKWPEHQTGRLHANGGADQSDLHRPRGIERSS